MKSLLIIAFLLTTFTSRHTSTTSTDLSCVLTSEKEVYKIGELPKLTVKIYNDSKKSIYLIGSLDGSDVKWRYPYCYYTIDRPKPVQTKLQRCGNMNTLRLQDFKLIPAGQEFNPYESIDGYGYFTDNTTADKETFKIPGVYRIKFHYSTKSQDINQYIGDKPLRNDPTDSLQLDSLFRAVPKVELVSNEIVIKVSK